MVNAATCRPARAGTSCAGNATTSAGSTGREVAGCCSCGRHGAERPFFADYQRAVYADIRRPASRRHIDQLAGQVRAASDSRKITARQVGRGAEAAHRDAVEDPPQVRSSASRSE